MFKRRKLIWQLYRPYLLILVISLLSVAVFASNFLKNLYYKKIVEQLKDNAHLFEASLTKTLPDLPSDNLEKADKLCKEAGSLIATRFTVILPDGTVIGDSHEDPSRMDNHATRPEIQSALRGEIGINTRFSGTLEKELIYVAVPVMRNSTVIAVVRTSKPGIEFRRTLNAIYLKIAFGGLMIALLAALISLAVSQHINRPITEMKKGAERFARGELEFRLHVPSSEEMDALAEAMNTMAAQLHARIETIKNQKNELEAVLSSMVEAVIAVDMDERIIEYNEAAETLFNVTSDRIRGQNIENVITNSYIHQFISTILSTNAPVDSENIVQQRPERFLQAHGTPLRDSEGKNIGALIVFNDITRLKALENIRRDFVANVSHELKTPITSIKGFVETLKDGAVHDPENASRFLTIILKHTDRLNAIIEDLLTLSRLEQETEYKTVVFSSVRVQEVLKNALSMCHCKAEEKNITLELTCDESLEVKGTPELLEHAVVNLIDNAIKFSVPNSRVDIESYRQNSTVIIKIEDRGCGISAEHLPRIFERFYRVDKARSRELGGTGLGLSIVKHIVQSLNGSVSVESTPGKGSSFYIHLPG